MGNFYTDQLRNDKRFASTAVCKDMALLEPGTRAAVVKLLALAQAAGHDLRVGETFRSQARQRQVFQAGASKLSKVGCHGYGLACDLGLFVNGKYEVDGTKYRFLEKLCRAAGLISGADWGDSELKHTFHDWCHVQRVPLFRQAAVFAGQWYPPADYDPYADMLAHGRPVS